MWRDDGKEGRGRIRDGMVASEKGGFRENIYVSRCTVCSVFTNALNSSHLMRCFPNTASGFKNLGWTATEPLTTGNRIGSGRF